MFSYPGFEWPQCSGDWALFSSAEFFNSYFHVLRKGQIILARVQLDLGFLWCLFHSYYTLNDG